VSIFNGFFRVPDWKALRVALSAFFRHAGIIVVLRRL
jgi:hypothetical protein